MKKQLLTATGFLSLSLGFAGIFIPLLPTTPFLLLASACFFKSSEKLHFWLINHKIFGRYIENYEKHRAVTKNAKIFTLTTLWLVISYSAIFAVTSAWISILLLLTAFCVTIHILRMKTA